MTRGTPWLCAASRSSASAVKRSGSCACACARRARTYAATPSGVSGASRAVTRDPLAERRERRAPRAGHPAPAAPRGRPAAPGGRRRRPGRGDAGAPRGSSRAAPAPRRRRSRPCRRRGRARAGTRPAARSRASGPAAGHRDAELEQHVVEDLLEADRRVQHEHRPHARAAGCRAAGGRASSCRCRPRRPASMRPACSRMPPASAVSAASTAGSRCRKRGSGVMRKGGSPRPKNARYMPRCRLEGALDPDRRDDRVVAQALVVQRVDAVREQHDAAPDHRPEPEGEVEEVLASEVDAEERLRLDAVRGEVEEVGVGGGMRVVELAPAEERERPGRGAGSRRRRSRRRSAPGSASSPGCRSRCAALTNGSTRSQSSVEA